MRAHSISFVATRVVYSTCFGCYRYFATESCVLDTSINGSTSAFQDKPLPWKNFRKQLHFLRELSSNLRLESHDDWYRVTAEQVREYGGNGLIQANGSFINALEKNFPDHKWKRWKFEDFNMTGGFWKQHSNRKEFLEDFASEHFPKSTLAPESLLWTPEHWYRITPQMLIDHGGAGLLLSYHQSMYQLLSDIFPEVKWKPWLFKPLPRGFWQDASNQKLFLSDLAHKMGVNQWRDWLKVSEQDFEEHGGAGLMNFYQKSAFKTISSVFAKEYNWGTTDEQRLHDGPDDEASLLEKIERIGEQLNVRKVEDWYDVQRSDFCKAANRLYPHHRLITEHDHSFRKIVTAAYPNYFWQLFRFAVKPAKVQVGEHRAFFDSLGQQLFFQLFSFNERSEKQKWSLSDWYQVRKSDLIENGVMPLLKTHYQGSLLHALESNYGEFRWDPALFSFEPSYPHGFWQDSRNRLQFFDHLAKELGHKTMEDWYNIRMSDFVEHGGYTLLRDYYKSSPLKALQSVYPNYDWKPWKFSKVGQAFWDDERNVRTYLDWLGKELHVQKISDWSRVQTSQVLQKGGATLLSKYGGLFNLLSHYYPDHKWNLTAGQLTSQHQRHSKTQQNMLLDEIQQIFPTQEVVAEYHHKNAS